MPSRSCSTCRSCASWRARWGRRWASWRTPPRGSRTGRSRSRARGTPCSREPDVRAEPEVGRWDEVWERRRQRCLRQDDLGEGRAALSPEVLAILAEARELAGVADPAVHAAMAVDRLIERVNALPHPAPVLLHGPVCNGLAMLRLSAQELLAA